MTGIEEKARAIFLAALEREPDGWPAFLDRACGGSAELRARVEQLLHSHRSLGSIDARSEAPRATADDVAVAEGPGAVIGPYKLLERIGEGGFGVVFMAEQSQPVRRRVALKVLKLGMDTRQVVARFEAERQVLAILDHPHIAKVFDGGATTSGRPYFVMELVKGTTITEFCDQNHLTPRQRLELFLPVCQAVQHAHQKGIIHRDLKPSNILVVMHDTNPVPKVIDFGIAKALGQQLTDKTLFTGFVQMIGTPLYMSPEQAGQSGLDIDTRSDIYSLGVLLYELLTGTTLFPRERFQQAAYDEIRRIIREEEPPRPSTRLSESKESLPSISVQRQTEPAKLTRLLRGELDWIVMKALEKDRSRRYETANGFAMDVQRYLADEPVRACPPSRWYGFRKFVRRNKGAVTTAAALALAVLLAVVTLAVTNVKIWQEQARTKDEKERAEVAEKLAKDRAEEIRQGMERLKAANALLDRGRWYASERRWDDAHAAFTKAIQMRPDHVSVWVERADLHVRLGLWDLAAADFAREFELREPDSAWRWFEHALLRCYVGDLDGYRQVLKRMRAHFRGTAQEGYVGVVARTCVLAPDANADLGSLVGPLEFSAASHSSWYRLYYLGMVHHRAGQQEPAVRRLRESLAVEPNLAVRVLSCPILAMAHHRLGQADEARQALDEAARAIDQWTRERYQSQGYWVQHLGAEAVWPVSWFDWLECQVYYREAKLLIDGTAPPDDPRLRVLRARAFAGLRWSEKAAAEYDAALKLNPQDPQVRLESHRNRGYGFTGLRQWGKAAAEFAKASELQPDDSNLWRFRAVAHFAMGDADAYRQTCAAMLQRFKKTEDDRTAANVLLACVLRDDTFPDMGRLLPLTRVVDRLWHWGTWVRGAALYRAGRYEEAVRCLERAAMTFNPRAWDWCFLAMAHHRLRHDDEARRCLAEAARWIDQANHHEGDDQSATRPSWGDWHEPVLSRLLLREAEALLNNGPVALEPSVLSPEDAARKDLENLQGTWYRVYIAHGHTVWGEDRTETITYEGNRYVLKSNGVVWQAGTFRIVDATASPKQMDYTSTEGEYSGRHFPSIYTLDGDDHETCSVEGKDNRPQEFSGQVGYHRVTRREKR